MYDFAKKKGDTLFFRYIASDIIGYSILGDIELFELENGAEVRKYLDEYGNPMMIESVGSDIITFEPRWREYLAHEHRIRCVNSDSIFQAKEKNDHFR